jgi:hypothetical protein
MNAKTLYIAVVTILLATTVAGAFSSQTRIIQQRPSQPLIYADVELTNLWVNYLNDTQLYQYGAEITITNNRETNLTLTNLKTVFTGQGRNSEWSGICQSADINIPPHGSKSISLHSPDTVVTNLGYSGSAAPREYLNLILQQVNLGIHVSLEGTDLRQGEAVSFAMETMGLPSGTATPDEFKYAHDLVRLGFTNDFLDRWIESFNYMPGQDLFRYHPLQRGILGTAKFPLLTVYGNIFSHYYSVSLSVIDARTLTASGSTGSRVFYLFGRDYKFTDYVGDISLGRDGESVYFYGDVFDYLSQSGVHYSVMFPTRVSKSEIRDPVEVARGILVSRVGEAYFDEYFSDPVAEYNPNGDWSKGSAHIVSFTYHISAGDYSTSQPIYLYFSSNWNLTSGEEYIPVAQNLQPFKVTRVEAEEIAVKAGVPSTPYGLEANIGSTGSWSNAQSSYRGLYIWSVSGWIDPPEANPRRFLFALIDPLTGKVYGVDEGGVFSIP